MAIGLTRVLSNGRIEFIYNQYPVCLEMDDKRVQVFLQIAKKKLIAVK